jgi:serine/threonine-protein kinase
MFAVMATPGGAIATREDDHDPRLGMVLAERYRIDSLIDSGGMGRVYVGEHVLMHKRVAIKVLHRELSSIPEFVARFEREARAAGNIGDEHVVAATDFGKLPDGAVFLVLEYVEGRNLRDEIAQGPMPLARTLHIARQITGALRAAHALGIVHRDLKPENVMLVNKAGDPDFVKVLDFGIAKVPIGERTSEDSKPITKAGMVFGTPEYMPPEQALGQSVDSRADLYSLGVIMYEMLAGRRPFGGESEVSVLGQQLSRSAPPVSKRAPGAYIPPSIDTFVKKMLHREASRRFQTADQILDEIDRHLGYSSGRRRIPTLTDGSQFQSTEPPPVDSLPPPPDDDDVLTIPGAASPLEQLTEWIETKRRRLPPSLRRLPAPVLISVPLALAGVMLGFGVFAAFSPAKKAEPAPVASVAPVARAETPPAPALATASRADLESAANDGVSALRTLAAKYPNDAAVQMAIGAAALKAKDQPAAVEALGQALTLDGKLQNDTQMASALWILAQSKQSSDAAFELLTGPMGTRGRSILHDLATTSGVRPAIKKKAEAALR